MLATLALFLDAIPRIPDAEDLRAGVYVWAGIVGLMTSAVISVVKETRAAAKTRA